MTRREVFLASPFMRSPFIADVKRTTIALVSCVIISLDYTN